MNSERVVSRAAIADLGLYSVAQTRLLETAKPAQTDTAGPSLSLMQLAGHATAKLAMAIAPHADVYWIACGPGNNGGDGMEAATHLKRWGKNPVITLLPAEKYSDGGHATALSDAGKARQAAIDAGIPFGTQPPSYFDAAIDAMFGIGALRPWTETHAQWINAINTCPKYVLAVDVPSGLNADTGATTSLHVRASHTLSLLTLKPGLFTKNGRDACGDIWFNDLGIVPQEYEVNPAARILPPQFVSARLHASHKGTMGDVCVVGGAPGMTGAALLAGSAALHGGAGRVYVCLLDSTSATLDPNQPELMFRALATMDLARQTVVAGCGGGHEIAPVLPRLLDEAERLVLDADALNAISADKDLQKLLLQRRRGSTVITPHPLEAARLLGGSTTQIQADRLKAARELARMLMCTVVLKGSGSIVCTPESVPLINITGNGYLATAGTGDVLAGLIGACWKPGASALPATCEAVYRHGQVADLWASSLGSAPVESESKRPPPRGNWQVDALAGQSLVASSLAKAV